MRLPLFVKRTDPKEVGETVEKGIHVLVADSESLFRFSAKVALRKAGYEVSEARDGNEALSMTLEARNRGEMFSLLLVDVRLPVVSRLGFLEALKRHSIETPVIAMTDYSSKEFTEELMKSGYAGYIEKTFEPRELVERIDNFLVNLTT
jgi:DNA-binding response OmpR family regulator